MKREWAHRELFRHERRKRFVILNSSTTFLFTPSGHEIPSGSLGTILAIFEGQAVRTKILKEEVMAMIRILTGILASGLVLGAVTTIFADPFTRREARQQARISRGVHYGQITPREWRHLEREQAAIEAHRRMAWSDGRLSPWEARHLRWEQNRASHDIWWSRHHGHPAW